MGLRLSDYSDGSGDQPTVGCQEECGRARLDLAPNGSNNSPPLKIHNKINGILVFHLGDLLAWAATVIGILERDPPIYVTHFIPRNAALIMEEKSAQAVHRRARMLLHGCFSKTSYSILSPARRLAPAASAAVGTVR